MASPQLSVAPAADAMRQRSRQELVQDDEHPAQAEQWKIGLEPAREVRVVAEDRLRLRAEAIALAVGERHARMEQHVGGELHGIVPAEIFEVDERQRSVGPAHGVVKAEIRRHQAAALLGQQRREVQAGRPHALLAARHQALPRRAEAAHRGTRAGPAPRPPPSPARTGGRRSGARSRRRTGRPRWRGARAASAGSLRRACTCARNWQAWSMSRSPIGADGGAVDPAQHGKPARPVGGHDPGHAVEPLPLHDGEGVDLGSQPIARVFRGEGYCLSAYSPRGERTWNTRLLRPPPTCSKPSMGVAQQRAGDLLGQVETVVRRVH